MSTIQNTLSEREKTHGSFPNGAYVSQKIKYIVKSSPNGATLSDAQLEALDMICHKISRIVTGNPNIKDHWDDIAGYALLISKELKE